MPIKDTIPHTELFNGADKVVHFMFYLGLSLILMVYFSHPPKRINFLHFILVASISIVIGGVIELIQPHFGRTTDIDDFIAGGIGGILGTLLIIPYRKIRKVKGISKLL